MKRLAVLVGKGALIGLVSYPLGVLVNVMLMH